MITENKEIPENSLVVGSPGKVIREVTEDEKKAVYHEDISSLPLYRTIVKTKYFIGNFKNFSENSL